MINWVVLVGRLTKDIDLSYTPQGIAKAQFTLAVNRSFANQSGVREADFIQIQAWRKQAEDNLDDKEGEGFTPPLNTLLLVKPCIKKTNLCIEWTKLAI